MPVFSIRDAGAVPAAIAVVDGALRVGLDEALLERFARGADTMKFSRADLAWGLVSGRLGALTVPATMIAAKLAGPGSSPPAASAASIAAPRRISIFRRISTSLPAPMSASSPLAPRRSSTCRKRSKMLESLGVPVICYRSDVFPAFWSRSNGLPAPIRIDSADDVAAFLTARDRLGLDGGILVANRFPPTPKFRSQRCRPISTEPRSPVSRARRSRRSCSKRSTA